MSATEITVTLTLEDFDAIADALIRAKEDYWQKAIQMDARGNASAADAACNVSEAAAAALDVLIDAQAAADEVDDLTTNIIDEIRSN